VTEYDFIERIKKELKDAAKAQVQYMKGGAYSDYASYREAVGRISSLEQILSFVEEEERKFLEQ